MEVFLFVGCTELHCMHACTRAFRGMGEGVQTPQPLNHFSAQTILCRAPVEDVVVTFMVLQFVRLQFLWWFSEVVEG